MIMSKKFDTKTFLFGALAGWALTMLGGISGTLAGKNKE